MEIYTEEDLTAFQNGADRITAARDRINFFLNSVLGMIRRNAPHGVGAEFTLEKCLKRDEVKELNQKGFSDIYLGIDISVVHKSIDWTMYFHEAGFDGYDSRGISRIQTLPARCALVFNLYLLHFINAIVCEYPYIKEDVNFFIETGKVKGEIK